MTIANDSTVTAYIVGTLPLVTLNVLNASITLDESRAPYAEAALTIATPSLAVLAQLDPRTSPRIMVTYADQPVLPTPAAAVTRTFNLLVHARSIADDSTTALTLVSDEALLIDDGRRLATPDTTLLPLASSLRAIVNNILARIGTTLQAGATDADVTPAFDATNLHIQPSVETGFTRWFIASGPGAGSQSPSVFRQGLTSYRVQNTAAGSVVINSGARSGLVTAIPVVPGTRYRFAVWVMTTGVGRTINMSARAYDASMNPLATGAAATPITSSGTWQEIAVDWTIPAGTEPLIAFTAMEITISTAASGQNHYFDTAQISPTYSTTDGINLAPGYFDGDTPADSLYTYAWESTANASASIRTAKTGTRDPGAVILYPGVKYWDFLAPLIESAGLRLYCNEARQWFLVATPTNVAGTVAASASANITEAADTISLRADYADAVVVTYSYPSRIAWNSFGVRLPVPFSAQTRYDVAGTGTHLLAVERDTAFPGAGLAAKLLARALARGREQEITMLTKITASPGQILTTDVPNVPAQTGRISAVTFRWAAADPDSDVMVVRPRDLVNT